MGKFVLKQTATGFKFDLKATIGQVIATSEVYTTEAACKNGIESVKNNCVGGVEDQTVENFETVKHPKSTSSLRSQRERSLTAFSFI